MQKINGNTFFLTINGKMKDINCLLIVVVALINVLCVNTQIYSSDGYRLEQNA